MDANKPQQDENDSLMVERLSQTTKLSLTSISVQMILFYY